MFLLFFVGYAAPQPGDLYEGFSYPTAGDIDVQDILQLPDGSIVLVGDFENYAGIDQLNYIVKIDALGNVDTKWSGNILRPNAGIKVIKYDEKNQQIYLGGDFTEIGGVNGEFQYFARIGIDGILDTKYRLSGQFDGGVNDISINTGTGLIAVVGVFSKFIENEQGFVILNESGNKVDVPGVSGGFVNDLGKSSVLAVEWNSDSEVLVGGYFSIFNGEEGYSNIVSIDVTKGGVVKREADEEVRVIKKMSDGSVMIGGAFSVVNGTEKPHIARFSSDGKLDGTFTVGLEKEAYIYVNDFVENEDGYYIVGNFTSVDGEAKNYIAKIAYDGKLNSEFLSVPAINAGDLSAVFSVEVLPDASLLIGGLFDNYGGKEGVLGVARIVSGDSPLSSDCPNLFAARFIGDGGILYSNQNVGELTNAFTIEAFVYPTSDGSILGKGDICDATGAAYELYLEPNGLVYAGIGNGESGVQLSTKNTISLNKWSHVALTKDKDGNLTIMINGAIENTGQLEGEQNISNPSSNFFVSQGCVGSMAGLVDEIRVWDYAKTENEVAAQMNYRFDPKSTSGLTSYITFDDGFDDLVNTSTFSTSGTSREGEGLEPLACASEVNDAPKADIITTDLTYCSNEGGLRLEAEVVEDASYSWYKEIDGKGFVATGLNKRIVDGITTGNYQVKVTNKEGRSSISDPVTVVENASPTISGVNGDEVVCPNSKSVSYAVKNQDGITFNWSLKSGDASISSQSSNTILLDFNKVASTISVVGRDNDNGCESEPSTLLISPGDLPSVVDPTGIVGCPGDKVNLEVTALGHNRSFSWFKDGNEIDDSDSDKLSLILTAATLGKYQVEVRACGETKRSGIATVSFYSSPSINEDDLSKDITVCEGKSVSLSVVADGDNLLYEWFQEGVLMKEEIDATLNISSVDKNTIGEYSVVVSNCVGNTTATIKVSTYVAPTFISAPNDVNVCEGESATISAKASGYSLKYQWQKGGVDIIGATTSVSYLLDAVTKADAGEYQAVVTDACGQASTSGVSILQVDPYVRDAKEIVGATDYCEGEDATFYIPSVTGADFYEWTYKGLGLKEASDKITLEGLTAGGELTVTPKPNAASACSDDGAASSLEIIVGETPPSLSITGLAKVCEGTSGVSYSTSGQQGSSFKWLITGNARITENLGNKIIVDFGTGDVLISVQEKTEGGCFGVSQDLTVAVSPTPKVSFSLAPVYLNTQTSVQLEGLVNGDVPTEGDSKFTSTAISITNDGRFDPSTVDQLNTALAITFNYISPDGCEESITKTTQVSDALGTILYQGDLTSTSSDPNSVYCKYDALQVFEGSAINMDDTKPFSIQLDAQDPRNGFKTIEFDPAQLTAGTHKITFAYQDVNSVDFFLTQTIQIEAVPMVSFQNDLGEELEDGFEVCEGDVSLPVKVSVVGSKNSLFYVKNTDSAFDSLVYTNDDQIALDFSTIGASSFPYSLNYHFETDNACSSETSISFSIHAQPQDNEIIGDDYSCYGDVKSYSIYPNQGESYEWSFQSGNGVFESGTTSEYVDVSFPAAGIERLQVVATTDEGCVGSVLSKDIVQSPPFEASAFTGPLNVAESAFGVNYSYKGGDLTYKWAVSGATLKGADDLDQIEVNFGYQDAVIFLQVSDSYGCYGDFEYPISVAVCQDPLSVTRMLDDSTCGSLRYAIGFANSDTDLSSIDFQLASSDSWVLNLTRPLPTITEPLIIDGTTQSGWNVGAGELIVLDGQDKTFTGLKSTTGNVGIYGMEFTNFKTAIDISGIGAFAIGDVGKENFIRANEDGIVASTADKGLIRGNRIGTNTKGELPDGNAVGIQLSRSANETTIENNLISGNGIGVHVLSSDKAQIIGNSIGTNLSATQAIPNGVGVLLENGSSTKLTDNIISGNTTGIELIDQTTTSIIRNKIGVGNDVATPIGNNIGIDFSAMVLQIAAEDTIGSYGLADRNIIANNSAGISISDEEYDEVTILPNIYWCNGTEISKLLYANDSTQAPIISNAYPSRVIGMAMPGTEVHLFKVNKRCGLANASQYLNKTTALPNGTWELTNVGLSLSDTVKAMVIDAIGNSSEFGATKIVETPILPAATNLMVDVDSNQVTVSWDSVAFAPAYTVLFGSDTNNLNAVVVNDTFRVFVNVPNDSAYYLAVATEFGDTTAFEKFTVCHLPVSLESVLTEICTPDETVITITGLPTNLKSVKWSNQVFGHPLTVNTSGNYFAIVEDVTGCVSTTNTISILAINPPSNEQGGVVLNFSRDTVVALGDSIALEVNGLNGEYFDWYEGQSPLGRSPVLNDSIYWVKFKGKYSVHVTNAYGCVAKSNVVVVDGVLPPAPKNVSALVDLNQITLSWSSVIGVSSYSVLVDNGALPIKAIQSNDTSLVIPNLNNGSYNIAVASVPGDTSDFVTVEICYMDLLFAGFDGGDVCQGDSLLLQLSGTPLNAEFLWSTGETSDSIFVSTSSDVFVAVFDGDCRVQSDTITVDVLPVPEPSSIATVYELFNGESAVIELNNVVDTYVQWFGNGIPIANQQFDDNLLVVDSIGYYFATVTGENGCSVSTDSAQVLRKASYLEVELVKNILSQGEVFAPMVDVSSDLYGSSLTVILSDGFGDFTFGDTLYNDLFSFLELEIPMNSSVSNTGTLKFVVDGLVQDLPIEIVPAELTDLNQMYIGDSLQLFWTPLQYPILVDEYIVTTKVSGIVNYVDTLSSIDSTYNFAISQLNGIDEIGVVPVRNGLRPAITWSPVFTITPPVLSNYDLCWNELIDITWSSTEVSIYTLQLLDMDGEVVADLGVSTSNSLNIKTPKVNSGEYQLQISNGVIDVVAPRKIIVNENKTPSVSIIGADLICSNADESYEADVVNGGSLTQFMWSLNGDLLPDTTATIIVDPLISISELGVRIVSNEKCLSQSFAGDTLYINEKLSPLAGLDKLVIEESISSSVIRSLANDQILDFDSLRIITSNDDLKFGSYLRFGESSIQYIPKGNVAGVDTILYELVDKCGVTAPGIAIIEVVKKGSIVLATDVSILITDEKKAIIKISELLKDLKGDFDFTTFSLGKDSKELILSDNTILSIDSTNEFLIIDYSNNPNFTGIDSVVYEICDFNFNCDEAYLSITTEQPVVKELNDSVSVSFEVYNGLSPDNVDGMGDYLKFNVILTNEIDGTIEKLSPMNLANIELLIYSKWGDKIIEFDSYDYGDETKRWYGQKQSGGVVSSGTYYYTLRVFFEQDGEEYIETHSGFIELKKYND